MWTLITGGFLFVMAVVFSLGKASSKREDATYNHREELLARSKGSDTEPALSEEPDLEPIEQPENNKENNAERNTPHPSEQL
ncbi:hypothetical protein ACRC6Q_04890 [Planococcus sp. SE5232]|uniref:hypothetical protein n=1 Tax=unclassified Planococcus (in: firmicutes) TaxID=2662419 RepID=UPI001CBB9604|nr:hypothetical protein [Planococcus sp. 4-30]